MFAPIQCAFCQETFDYDTTSGEPTALCPFCGKETPTQALEAPAESPPPAEDAPRAKLTLQRDAPTLAGSIPCPHCQAPIERDAVLCIHCGTNLATGKKIGVVMTISGDMSMKVPRISRITFINSRITSGLSEMFCSTATSCAGTLR